MINAATAKRLDSAIEYKTRPAQSITLTGKVLNDIIALGSQAFIAHVGQLPHENCVQIIQDTDSVTRIRVCAALDYLMDRAQQQVWAEPSPHAPRESRPIEQPS